MAPRSPDERFLLKYMTSPSASFTDLLAQHQPEALPWARVANSAVEGITHGTTIVALRFAGGVVMAGDRQATSGSMVGYRYAKKVHSIDSSSCIGVAGTSAIGNELVRLFQVDVLHYEKIEGSLLSLQGKANKLSAMVRGNLELAMSGLGIVPLYAGYDHEADTVRIFSYDPAGAMSEEYAGYYSIGSGSPFAMGSLKKLHRDDLTEEEALLVALEALYDASEVDVATMGPDVPREIYPIVHVVTAEGDRELTDDETAAIAQNVLDRRRQLPDGPRALLTPATQERPQITT